MHKEVFYGKEARQKLLEGVEAIAKAVSVTLGPRGRCVVIDKPMRNPIVTKDGVSVANEFTLKDKDQDIGVKIARQAAQQTANIAGDGTTTAIVLTHALYSEGLKYVLKSSSPVDLNKGMTIAKNKVVDFLTTIKKDVGVDRQSIMQIATISANGDKEIGVLIADAMEKVGKDGVITIDDSKTFRTHVEIASGMQYTSGYLSPYFVTNPDTMKFEEENPYILVANKRFGNVKELLNILNFVAAEGRSLVIIADEIEGEVMQTLVINAIRKTLKVCAIKSPSYGTKRQAVLEDIAAATRAQVFNDALLADVNMDQIGTAHSPDPTNLLKYDAKKYLGQAGKVIVSKDSVTIINGTASEEETNNRVESLKSQLINTVGISEVSFMQERIAKIRGGVAVIKVGASTEIELKERKDRVDDAVHATKCAVSQGIICGGGIALLRASNYLGTYQADFENKDQRLGYKLLKDSILSPFKTIVGNAGADAEEMLTTIQANDNPNYGWNAQKEQFEDLVEGGVIDPLAVCCAALENAVSAASMLLTTDCIMRESLSEKELEESIDQSLMMGH